METKITGYVARNKTDDLYFYFQKPEKLLNIWYLWNSRKYFILPKTDFPNLKWEDEPLKVEITIKEVKE